MVSFMCHHSKINRTVQCESCKLILEERFASDLTEYHAITQTEEVQCVVGPDHLHKYLVDVCYHSDSHMSSERTMAFLTHRRLCIA